MRISLGGGDGVDWNLLIVTFNFQSTLFSHNFFYATLDSACIDQF